MARVGVSSAESSSGGRTAKTTTCRAAALDRKRGFFIIEVGRQAARLELFHFSIIVVLACVGVRFAESLRSWLSPLYIRV